MLTPARPDWLRIKVPAEPEAIAATIREMEIRYCVLTMVTRDDLSDGGASHIHNVVDAIRKRVPAIKLELLISDLAGNEDALNAVLATRPSVLNQNIETVERLYARIRPQARYTRSLALLKKTARNALATVTKSGMMLGLGESRKEVIAAMIDLRDVGCQILTLGQYLQPSKRHHPVTRYVHPDEFASYRLEALDLGFSGVASGPLVRS